MAITAYHCLLTCRLAGYKEWIPGIRAVAAAAAMDAAAASGHSEAAMEAGDLAARTHATTLCFVTASATLCNSVCKAFRRMQVG